MGWWSTSIMGGDTPLDIEHDFERLFEDRIPTADEGLRFLTQRLNEDDDPVIKQVVAFLLIERASPLHPEVRRQALAGLAAEDTSEWDDPAERAAVLAEFANVVKLYPAEGGQVELPNQPGLFETIMGDG